MLKIRLAPLCGVTDSVYREICYEQGCDLAYTEMISAMGYLCSPDQQAQKRLMERGKDEPRLVIQLFGRDPDVVAEAAKRIDDLGIYDGIDLNMGCPAHKIAPSGEGCGLMRTPETARSMMEKTVRAVHVPVSVKMRLGWDREHINVKQMAAIARDAGISEITIHGRTREQQYSGTADWNMVRETAAECGIPVIGNGDITTAEEGISRLNEYGVQAIMIGRGAMGNPWIFRNLKRRLAGKEELPATPEERYGMIRTHYRRMMETRPEHIAVREMRKHIGWYLHGMRGAGKTRFEINREENPEAVFRILDCFFENAEEEEKSEGIS